MRDRLKGRKLGRTSSHRQALERNIVTSLFTYGRIITTAEKAKEFRGTAEHLVQLVRRPDVRVAGTHVRRRLVWHVALAAFAGVVEQPAARPGQRDRDVVAVREARRRQRELRRIGAVAAHEVHDLDRVARAVLDAQGRGLVAVEARVRLGVRAGLVEILRAAEAALGEAAAGVVVDRARAHESAGEGEQGAKVHAR